MIETKQRSGSHISDVRSATFSRTFPARSSSRLLILLFFLAIFSVILAREFFEGEGLPSRIYDKSLGGFRWMDLMLMGIFFLAFSVRLGVGGWVFPKLPHGVRVYGATFLVAIGLSMAYGALNGGTNLYFDWRNIILGAGFGLVLYNLLGSNNRWLPSACVAMTLVIAARAFVLLGSFFLGRSQTAVLGVATPVFDGAALTTTVFAGLAGLIVALTFQGKGGARFLMFLVGVSSVLLVILSFRRTFWGQLAVGAAISLLLLRRGRLVILSSISVLVLVAYLQIGPDLVTRGRSANPIAGSGRFANTNQDHVGDVLDAWDVIKSHPILGYGLGREYPTRRIADWKTKSWGVHNGPLHAWLRYGILGVLSYLGIHLSIFNWLYRLNQRLPPGSFEKAWITSTLGFLVGVFVMSLGFSPWPYGALQPSIIIFSLLAIAFQIERLAGPSDRILVPEGKAAKSRLGGAQAESFHQGA